MAHLAEVQINMYSILCWSDKPHTQKLGPSFPQELAFCHGCLTRAAGGAGGDVYGRNLILPMWVRYQYTRCRIMRVIVYYG